MYRLGPCIPIFFFGGGGGIKRAKGCVYVIMLKIVLILFKIYVLMWKKGISGLLRLELWKCKKGAIRE